MSSRRARSRPRRTPRRLGVGARGRVQSRLPAGTRDAVLAAADIGLAVTPSPSSPPALGYLLAAPGQLSLTSKAGKPASGSFELTAVNGPVPRYTVRVAGDAGKVSVSPAGGSLPVNGMVTVTVTVTSKVALSTQVTVEPNSVSVTVVYTPKPKPSPSPTPTSGGGGGG